MEGAPRAVFGSCAAARPPCGAHLHGRHSDFRPGGRAVNAPLGVAWIHGAAGEPAIQTHWYDEATVVLRQAKSLNYEAPFMFLLFGDERALLLDTGAVSDPDRFPLRATVDELVGRWLDKHPHPRYGLVVAH